MGATKVYKKNKSNFQERAKGDGLVSKKEKLLGEALPAR